MSVTVEGIVGLCEAARPVSGADYDVLSTPETGIRGGHLAVGRSGCVALLVPVARIPSDTTRLTHGLALRGASALEFARGPHRWSEPAAVLECRDPQLLKSFAAMVAAVLARVEAITRPTWQDVAGLFGEWERLFARRRILSGESELGLWAEMWCLARTRRPAELLAGWRGPDAERVDFLVDGIGFEVKAGHRPGVHTVSQSQVDESLGDVRSLLVSMHVMPDPLRGRSLAALVRAVGERVDDVSEFEEKLAHVGYSRDDESAYSRPYALLEAPRFYCAEDVPRVRSADPGVTHIRYRVELQPEAALQGDDLSSVTAVLGIDHLSNEYPCA